MIKTYDKTPEWLYYFISKIDELDDSTLTCKALKNVRSVSIQQHKPEHIYSEDPNLEWYPRTLVGMIPSQEFTIKIKYSDGEADGRFNLLSPYQVDFDEFDPRYHVFEYSNRVGYWLIKDGDRSFYFITFNDPHTQSWYAAYTESF